MVTVADVVAWSERMFPLRLAQSWDAVGLVCGWPEAQVRKILVCVDVTEAVVDRAREGEADLIFAHHPLLFSGVKSIAATDSRGRILQRLIETRCALLTAHTNADAANPGVSDALAAVLGLVDPRPLEPAPKAPQDKLVVFVPREHTNKLLDALTSVGAGRIGEYERCAYQSEGIGTFRPIGAARPAIGTLGQIETVRENRLELVMARQYRADVVAALLATHPYEQPAFDVTEITSGASSEGLGRIGHLPDGAELSLASFTERVAAALPAAAQGLRVTGDLTRPVRRVAVCGGSGDSLLPAVAAAAVDVYVTSDLKHHRVLDHISESSIGLIDVAHWASEYPWLWQLADQLRTSFGDLSQGGLIQGGQAGSGSAVSESAPAATPTTDAATGGGVGLGAATGVEVEVCTIRTDPWTAMLRSNG